MATYKKVSRAVPSAQRSMAITDVVAGDEIDVSSILGRPARQVKFIPGDSADTIDIRLNNRRFLYGKFKDTKEEGMTTMFASAFDDPGSRVEVVSKGDQYPIYTMSGADSYYTEEGLVVDFIQVADITYATSPAVALKIEVW